MLMRNRTLLLIYVLTFLVHLPLLLYPPSPFYYNTDEQQLTFSALDRFMGLPSSCLQWPGTTLQILFIPVFLALFILKTGIAGPTAMAAHFASFLANSYEYPQQVVTAMRILSLLVNSTAPVFAFILVRKLSRSFPIAAVTATVFALQPLFFEFSVVALGDAVSITFALAGITVLLCSVASYRHQLSGFLFAAALASKITIAGIVALPIALILLDKKNADVTYRWKRLIRFVIGLSFGFLLFNPYLWTDPVRYAKALVGTALKRGAAANLHLFLSKFEMSMGLTYTTLATLVIVGAAAVQYVHGFKSRLTAALAVFGLLILPIYLSANTSEPRYLLPALLALLVITGLLLEALQTSNADIRLPKVLLIGFVVLVIAGLAAEITRMELAARRPDDLTEALAYAQGFDTGTTLYVPQEAFDTPFLHPTTATLERIVSEVRPRLQSDVGTIAFLTTQHIPAVTARILVQAFNDDEQVTLRQLIARTEHTGSGSRDLFVFASPLDPNLHAKRSSLAEMDEDQALRLARTGHKTAILLAKVRPELGQPEWRGRDLWVWYRFS